MAFICPTCGNPRENPADIHSYDRHTGNDGSECHHEMYGVAVPAIEVAEDKVPVGMRYFDADDAHLPEHVQGSGCCGCGRHFRDGERYTTKFEGLTDDGTPIASIVCLDCGA